MFFKRNVDDGNKLRGLTGYQVIKDKKPFTDVTISIFVDEKLGSTLALRSLSFLSPKATMKVRSLAKRNFCDFRARGDQKDLFILLKGCQRRAEYNGF